MKNDKSTKLYRIEIMPVTNGFLIQETVTQDLDKSTTTECGMSIISKEKLVAKNLDDIRDIIKEILNRNGR